MKQLQLAANIADLRHEHKITQDELAEFLGVTKASISKWENEQSYPDITLLPKLAAYFDISIDQLLGYKAQMTKEKIDEWFNEQDLGAGPVRNEKLIISDIFKMLDNPALSILFEHEEYEKLKRRLKKHLHRGEGCTKC